MTEPATVPGGTQIAALRLPDSERVTSGGSSRLFRFGFWLILLLLIAGAVIAYRRNHPWLQELRGSEYETAVVTEKGTDEVALEVSGFVVPHRMLNVSPRVPGSIVELNFEVGQKVKKGELLAQLDDSSVRADLQQAEAAALAATSRLEEARNGALPEEVNQARIALDVAKSKYELVTNEVERAKLLGDSTTKAEMDQLVSAQKDADAQVRSLEDKLKLIEQGLRPERMKAIEADVKQTQALVAKAQFFLENTRILAPLDGTILEKNAEVGEILRPEVLSVSLCKLADMSVMEVEIDIQERELQKVEVGRPCRIIPDAYPDRTYTGKIDRIQPTVIRARGVVRVSIRIDEPDQYLLSEMNVRAIIESPTTEGPVVASLWAPEAVVVTEGDKSFVFQLNEGKAVRKPVEIGEKAGRRVELKSGVAAGDVLVLAAGKRIVDGQTIGTKSTR